MPNSQRRLAASCVFVSLLCACAARPEVGSDYDHNVNFARYHSFAVMPHDHGLPGLALDPAQNPLVIARTEDDITQSMQRKGYTLTDPLHADLIVEFTVGAPERIDVQSYPTAGGLMPAGPYWGNNLDVRQYHEGALSIDLFDAHTRRPVWHGWTKKELSREELQQSADPTSKAVESVLANLPSSS